MAVESVFKATREELRLPDTGMARDDFRAQITGLAALLHGPARVCAAGMLGEARADAILAQALKER